MTVRYISVTPLVNLFKPATRAFGDIAFVGGTDADAVGPKKTPVAITNPYAVSVPGLLAKFALKTSKATAAADSKLEFAAVPRTILVGMKIFDLTKEKIIPPGTIVKSTTSTSVVMSNGATGDGVGSGDEVQFVGDYNGEPVFEAGWFKGDLGNAVRKAFDQSPGPTTVWAVATDSADGNDALAKGLAEVAKLDVRIVGLANTPLGPDSQGRAQIEALASHVNTVSNTGGDGKERIGAAMLGKGVSDPGVITSNMQSDRMFVVAHKSDEDAAAAAAGVIAGYEPHVSLLLKPVSLGMDSYFSDSEIDAFNTAQINWLVDPSLIPGKGLYLGEGYSLGSKMPYIDIVRTVDDISFRLKAQLIQSIGNLRVTRSGLRALVSQMTAILEPLLQRQVIDGYDVFIPLLVLLDKDPLSLADVELQQIKNAQDARTIDAIVTVDYAGAIHRLNITLAFK